MDHIETFPNIGGFFLANLANITSKILALTGVTFERLFGKPNLMSGLESNPEPTNTQIRAIVWPPKLQ